MNMYKTIQCYAAPTINKETTRATRSIKVSKRNKSVVNITINGSYSELDCNLSDDVDLAKAAVVLINACKDSGQINTLKKMLMHGTNVINENFDVYA